MGIETSRNIRIAYVVNKFETGGVKSLLMNYFQHLDRDRFSVDFIVCIDGSTPSDHSKIASLGGTIHVVDSIDNPVLYISSCIKVLQKGNYDIVQTCMNSLNVFPLLAAKLAKIPVRVSYNLTTSHPGERKTIIKNALRPFGNLFATDRAANSEIAWNWLFRGESSSEYTIIPNAIDLETYHYDEGTRTAIRSKLGFEDSFIIGHIGRYEYQKNHLFLLEVFSEVLVQEPQAKLVLVGYGSMKEQIFAKAEELGIRKSIIDLGATESLPELYNAFDCFVLPSFYEGFPVVAVEAQATGCPCVFSSEITNEAGVIEQVEFLPLSKPISEWAHMILQFQNSKRDDGANAVIARGFEIATATKRLESFYSQQLDK